MLGRSYPTILLLVTEREDVPVALELGDDSPQEQQQRGPGRQKGSVDERHCRLLR